MLQYISFGSGSSGNCSMLYTANEGLLIDAGVGIRTLKKHFKNYGLPMGLVKNVIITHDHTDHIKCVGSLTHDYNLPIYATEKVHRGIAHSWCIRHTPEPTLINKIEKNVPVNIGNFVVTPFGVPHDSSDNVGYCIEYNGITFVHTTDIGHVTDEMKPYIRRANYLVIEADFEKEVLINGKYDQSLKDRILSPTGHLSNEECAVAIAENCSEALRYVWLCHLSNENNHPVLAEKTVTNILNSYGIKVGDNAEADFQLEVLKRTSPSGPFLLDNPNEYQSRHIQIGCLF